MNGFFKVVGDPADDGRRGTRSALESLVASGLTLLRTSREQLGLIAGRIAEYLEQSERVFLETGDRLQDLSDRATRLVGASATAAAASAACAGPLSRLEVDRSGLEGSVSEARTVLGGCSTGLGRVMAGIDALAAFEGTFQRVSQMLRVLAVRTRIENARCAHAGAAFEAVGQDVRRFAGFIEPRFDAVLVRAAELRRAAEGAEIHARCFLERDAAHIEAELAATASCVDALLALHRSAEALGEHATIGAERIAQHVAGVLTSLQAHDIARQVLEHARDALNAAADPLEPCDGDVESRLADVAATSRLQASQIRRAYQVLEAARSDLGTQLARIADEASALAHGVTAHAEDGAGASTLDEIARSLRAASTAILEQSAREGEIASAMRHVGGAMSELTAHAKAIARMGADVRFIALNAKVQAMSAGIEGRALVVLASAVREVAVEIDQQIQRVAEIMKGVETAAASLQDGASHAFAASSEAAVANMRELTDGLAVQHALLQGGLLQIRGDGAAVRSAVGQLSQSLVEHGIASDELANLGAELDAISAAATSAVSAASAAAALGRTGALAHYTMEGERVVHRAIAGEAPVALPACSVATSDADLGDNVELF